MRYSQSAPFLMELGEVELLSSADAGIRRERQLPFMRLVISWNLFLGFVTGTAIWLMELGNTKPSWLRCFFIALNSSTATGLTAFDLTRLRWESLLMIACCMQLGAMTLLSLFPVLLRIWALEAALPRRHLTILPEAPTREEADVSFKTRMFSLCKQYLFETRHNDHVTFDLRRYRLVPQWLVEYKALTFLLRIVLAYHCLVYLVYGSSLFLYVQYCTPARRLVDESPTGATPLTWTLFHVVSAYNNVGFTLETDAMTKYVGHPFILFALAMLILHGNVFFPMCIRWIIVFLSATSPKHSNRKVFFRYLLLHGRKLYSSLFSSQATWLLCATQLIFIFTQVAATVLISRKDPGFKDRSPAHNFDVAAFEAINSRHAGMTVLDLKTLHGATLLLMLLMMWLAPVPFVVALRSTSKTRQTPPPPEPPSRLTDDSSCNTQNINIQENPRLSPTSANRRRRHSVGRLISTAFTHQHSILEAEDQSEPHTLRVSLQEIPDAMVDTRALLLGRYPESSPPYRERILMRLHAFMYHCRRAMRSAYRTTGFVRDCACMFLAWFCIAAFQNFRASDYGGGTAGQQRNSDHIFHALFELVSAFGNVGLSLGSIQAPNAAVSYSHDLNAASLIVLCLVQIGARTRELPERVDSALTFPILAAEDVLRATMVDDQGACTPAFQDASTPAGSVHSTNTHPPPPYPSEAHHPSPLGITSSPDSIPVVAGAARTATAAPQHKRPSGSQRTTNPIHPTLSEPEDEHNPSNGSMTPSKPTAL